MENKTNKYLIGCICAIVAMFAWIFIAVALTGGREVEEFTKTDRIIMTCFAILEITTVIFALLLAGLTGKEYGKRMHQQSVKTSQKPDRKGIVLWILAYVIALGGQISGILLEKAAFAPLKQLRGWALGISIAVAAIGLLCNILLKKWYTERFEKQQVSQTQHFIYSHRDRAEETAARKLAMLKKWSLLTDCYAVLLGLVGLCIAVCSGIGYSSGSAVPFCFAASLLLMCAFSRIRFPVSRKVFDQDRTYISEEEYPHLYAIAKKAAKTTGCSDQIRIALMPDCNAGIAKVGKIYSVQLGVILLGALSEEELYSVLLHEFAHVTQQNRQALQQRRYRSWLEEGKIPHYASGITERFFDFFDVFYEMQFLLYYYAASIVIESAADQAMLLSKKPEAVGSALVKLKYYELFQWEKGTQDEPCIYQPETPESQMMAKELASFLQAMKQRSGDWQRLRNVEIQSRSATHPTLKLRLEALEIRDPQPLVIPTDSDYVQECKKALDFVDGLLCSDLTEVYEEYRKAYYLEPKELVEQWEAADKPLVAEEYSDIVWALRQLGRNRDAIELCERAIAELPAAASCGGYFIRGCHRLHCYEEAGIADIYFAIENNSNFLEEGIDAIGAFCCLTGNQEELDIYREKAIALAQLQKDQYSQTETLTKKDHLSEEHLPEGMLEDILSYIASVDEGQIEKLYLVRKTITEDFFTSVFVVRFALDAPDEECDKLLHKIFRYLDTCSDWQFSLFDYRDVMNVPVYEIKNSCVYSKNA